MLSEEQKKARLEGIGGSEIAAVAGLDPFSSPLEVWRAKCDPDFSKEVTEPMERGTFLEDGMLNWYAHRTGSKVRKVGTLRHPSLKRVMSSPDGLATPETGTDHDVSVKCPGRFIRGWGEPGTDEVPVAALLQVQWELLILEAMYGIRDARVVALINDGMRIYNLSADSEVQGRLVEIAQKFWRDHVETGRPPPEDGSQPYADWLAERYPERPVLSMLPNPEAEELMEKLRLAREAKARAELEEEVHKQGLQRILLSGMAESMETDRWRILWRKPEPKVDVDWKAVALELGADAATIQRHTLPPKQHKPKFLPTWSK